MTKLENISLGDLKGLISIAKKAGFVIAGQDNLVGYRKKLYLLLLDEGAGESLQREMNFLASKRNIILLKFEKLEEIVMIPNCKVIGIKNKNFAEEIVKKVKGE